MKALSTRATLGSLAGLALLTLFVAGSTFGVEADAVFSDFKPSGDFDLEIAGETVEDAEIYQSDRAASYLIIAPSLKSPLLINTRTGTVENVSLLKVLKRDDGKIDLLSDASFQALGKFQIGPEQLKFQLKGESAVLKAKPPLLGLHQSDTLSDHNAAYAYKANVYQPNAEVLAGLRGEQRDVRVRVYFGSWCPVCSRTVPKSLKLADALEDSKLNFEFYGLPKPMSDDPISERENIRGVPTAIIYVGDQEVGRLSGRELAQPEAGISRLLSEG